MYKVEHDINGDLIATNQETGKKFTVTTNSDGSLHWDPMNITNQVNFELLDYIDNVFNKRSANG